MAFAELCSRYGHEVYAYAMSLVKLPDVAEDLVQDVFIRIWDARHKIAIKKDFRPYLFRVKEKPLMAINQGFFPPSAISGMCTPR